MKKFIITEAQIQIIGNAVASVPTVQGMKVIDVLRSVQTQEQAQEELPELPK